MTRTQRMSKTSGKILVKPGKIERSNITSLREADTLTTRARHAYCTRETGLLYYTTCDRLLRAKCLSTSCHTTRSLSSSKLMKETSVNQVNGEIESTRRIRCNNVNSSCYYVALLFTITENDTAFSPLYKI